MSYGTHQCKLRPWCQCPSKAPASEAAIVGKVSPCCWLTVPLLHCPVTTRHSRFHSQGFLMSVYVSHVAVSSTTHQYERANDRTIDFSQLSNLNHPNLLVQWNCNLPKKPWPSKTFTAIRVGKGNRSSVAIPEVW